MLDCWTVLGRPGGDGPGAAASAVLCARGLDRGAAAAGGRRGGGGALHLFPAAGRPPRPRRQRGRLQDEGVHYIRYVYVTTHDSSLPSAFAEVSFLLLSITALSNLRNKSEELAGVGHSQTEEHIHI